ncbi:hypothetical protein NDU88_004472 [Pleurodeles waltl]|uniref:Uncharacterized protein n=1 Tax=Pleurodeles waltl TaxID=8319 RepID=A0AAV7WS28_PLEWA|nr:hypothetical protein NDU88_004472 [Pleurodeles waltl]
MPVAPDLKTRRKRGTGEVLLPLVLPPKQQKRNKVCRGTKWAMTSEQALGWAVRLLVVLLCPPAAALNYGGCSASPGYLLVPAAAVACVAALCMASQSAS